ncbi:hsp70-Hsp90 organizing protein 1 [Oncorhynchus kisutch]|nr:hsp70-Hsp90 organizing protein 1 [Oncorhynchus kisutch]XP_031675427.1 hsp70-Hsp90 organizing protein 1-like [Oncorhynchus kisutch]
MVELMKFTRDICRLLGIGGDGPGEQEEMERGGGRGGRGGPGPAAGGEVLSGEEEMERGGGRGGRGGPGPAAGGEVLSGEEEFSEEEKTRRRAERRRAKRKRQKERKKLEKEKSADAEQEGEASESESESEEEEEVERVVPPAKNKPTPPLTVSGNKSNRQPPVRTPEEEPEWDVRSAFVANAASHIRPKARTSAGHASRENKENESRTSEVESSDPVKKGASLTEKGIQLFKQGQYSQAVDMFSEAIHCDPKDHRFFGNRSYCYWCLELYPSALSDAQRSIQLAPDWPKGYFRKGSALMGLKRYGEAEGAMQQVLKLDQDCEEASIELFNCKVLQLMDLGFEEGQSVLLLEKFTTVQAALGSPEADRVVDLSSPEDSTG